MVLACSTSALSKEGMLPVNWDASRASLVLASVPDEASAVVVAVPRNPRRVTCAALALLPTAGAEPPGSDGNGKPSCAEAVTGHDRGSANLEATPTVAQRLW